MLTIADLFKMQATLNERVGLDDQWFTEAFAGPPFEDGDLIRAGLWIDDMLKAMSSEIEELRNCTFWKHWSQEAQHGFRYKVKDVGAARKEVIDILHFWIGLAQVLGMSPEMVCGMYLAKNIRRQDDGYSIEVKDLAWQLFKENSSSDAVWGTAESLEDLPDSTVQHYLRRAKRKLENLADLGRTPPGLNRYFLSKDNAMGW